MVLDQLWSAFLSWQKTLAENFYNRNSHLNIDCEHLHVCKSMIASIFCDDWKSALTCIPLCGASS